MDSSEHCFFFFMFVIFCFKLFQDISTVKFEAFMFVANWKFMMKLGCELCEPGALVYSKIK